MEHDVKINAADVANAISEAIYLAGATDWDDLGMEVADDLGDGRLEIHVGSRTFLVTVVEE